MHSDLLVSLPISSLTTFVTNFFRTFVLNEKQMLCSQVDGTSSNGLLKHLLRPVGHGRHHCFALLPAQSCLFRRHLLYAIPFRNTYVQLHLAVSPMQPLYITLVMLTTTCGVASLTSQIADTSLAVTGNFGRAGFLEGKTKGMRISNALWVVHMDEWYSSQVSLLIQPCQQDKQNFCTPSVNQITELKSGQPGMYPVTLI